MLKSYRISRDLDANRFLMSSFKAPKPRLTFLSLRGSQSRTWPLICRRNCLAASQNINEHSNVLEINQVVLVDIRLRQESVRRKNRNEGRNV